MQFLQGRSDTDDGKTCIQITRQITNTIIDILSAQQHDDEYQGHMFRPHIGRPMSPCSPWHPDKPEIRL